MEQALFRGYELYEGPRSGVRKGLEMTCYMRHMGWMFRVLDIDNDAGNRHRLDRAIKRTLGLAPDAPCADVEAYLAALSGEERFEFMDTLEQELANS